MNPAHPAQADRHCASRSRLPRKEAGRRSNSSFTNFKIKLLTDPDKTVNWSLAGRTPSASTHSVAWPAVARVADAASHNSLAPQSKARARSDWGSGDCLYPCHPRNPRPNLERPVLRPSACSAGSLPPTAETQSPQSYSVSEWAETASRFLKSRRLRQGSGADDGGGAGAASRLLKSRRLRPLIPKPRNLDRLRLTVPEVAATAAGSPSYARAGRFRLTVPEVAATAAYDANDKELDNRRLTVLKSRRLRLWIGELAQARCHRLTVPEVAATAASIKPGFSSSILARLTVPEVAATAADSCEMRHHGPSRLTVPEVAATAARKTKQF